MAFHWQRPASSIGCLLLLSSFSPEVSDANANSTASLNTASLPTQCDPASGLKEFIMPIIDQGHSSPQEHLPYGVLVDLFFRSQADPSANAIFAEPESWYKISNLHPCLRIDVKLAPHMDSPREAIIHTNRYYYWELQDDHNQVRTHTAMYGLHHLVHARSGMEADSLGILHVSTNNQPEVGNQREYPNFFRAAPTAFKILQPMWGFYKMYDWRAVMIIYSTDPRMEGLYEAFMSSAAEDGIAPSRIRNAPMGISLPLQTIAIKSQMEVLSGFPIRVIFQFVDYGADHKAALGTSFVDQIILWQMEKGLWLPTTDKLVAYQIISTRGFTEADIFQNASFRAMIGSSAYGSFFFSESHLREPSLVAAGLPARSWWLGQASKLGAIDVNKHEMQERYGLDQWPSSILQTVLDRVNKASGLPGLLLSMPAADIDTSWLKADIAMKQIVAHNCFLHKGGNMTVRDAALFGDCLHLVSREKKLFTFDLAFDDGTNEIQDIHHIFGPVYKLDPVTNASVSFWWNPVVRAEAGHHHMTGCSKAGRFTGNEAPVWGNGVQSDDPPEQILNCTAGMRKSGGTCKWCGAGRYSTKVDTEECILCPLGKFSPSVGSTTCTACAPGSEARNSGLHKCDSCQPGYYSNEIGRSSCVYCQIAEFADVRGATACTMCDAGFTTENIASPNRSDCRCRRGQYLSAENLCIDCMEGLACSEGWPKNWATEGGTVVLKPDFYSLKSAPYETYRCQEKGLEDGRCPGGPPEQCSHGLDEQTLVCNKCSKSGYHIVDGSCQECPEHLKLLLLFVILAGIVFIVAFFYLSNSPLAVNAGHPQDFAVFVGLSVTIFQIFGVLKQLQIQWPMDVGNFLDTSSSLFTARVSFSCAVGDSPTAQYLVQALLPYFLIALTAVLGIASRAIASFFQKDSIAWSFSKCLNVVGQVLQALFIAFCDIMVRPFDCYDHPNGKRSVVIFPQVLCWDSHDHLILTIIAAVILLFFILPYMSWCVWGCLQAPMKSAQKDSAFLESFRFMFYRFRPDCWWWGLVFLVRQTCLALAAIVPSSSAHAQLFYFGGILIIYAFFLAAFWPWISTELSIVDLGTCLMLVLILLCGSQFLPSSLEGGRVSLLVLLLLVLVSMVLRYLVVFTISACSNGLDDEVAGELPNRLDLCQQWFEFLDAMDSQHSKETVETISKMNTFDRYRILAMMHVWSANMTCGSSEKIAPRLSYIRSRTPLNEEAVGAANMRVSESATLSRGLEPLMPQAVR